MGFFTVIFFFFSSRRRHTRCREVSWARRCVQETGINAEYMGCGTSKCNVTDRRSYRRQFVCKFLSAKRRSPVKLASINKPQTTERLIRKNRKSPLMADFLFCFTIKP
eukprot:TRINITY_DN9248_c0_g1_i4.p1 TRINITY_DN9248_c0_g1~~TRINITY_DN9248_c0_g1_i4.p1  ORF type:complete len:108 (+),score=33.01 TRINITY_DN9248_c0_g1_i4:105-428(+)